MHDDLEKVLFSQDDIALRIKTLAEEVCRAYEGQSLTVICLSNGAIIFAADLI